MSGYNAEITAQESEPSEAQVTQRLYDAMKKEQRRARSFAEGIIAISQVELDMGTPSSTMYDQLQEIYLAYVDDATPGVEEGFVSEVLELRKQFRESEQGEYFDMEIFDLEGN